MGVRRRGHPEVMDPVLEQICAETSVFLRKEAAQSGCRDAVFAREERTRQFLRRSCPAETPAATMTVNLS